MGRAARLKVSVIDKDAPALAESSPKVIRFTVFGHPEPAGSKSSYVPLNKKTRQPFRRPNGGVVVCTVDANPKAKGWKSLVADAARQAIGHNAPLLDGPLSVSFVFYRARPKGHFGAHGLKPSAPIFPTGAPDALKLCRGTEDSLKGLVLRDDSQNVDIYIRKRYGEPERCEIEIAELA